MGPYDGHPASLDPLPPDAAARKMLEYMGGVQPVLERAREDFEAGEYRWVVEVGRHLVFADPANRAARELVADAMEQLAYQSESTTWRNAYLLGAKELRLGAPKPGPGAVISRKVVSMLPMGMFFDYLAIRVNADKAEGLQLRIDWRMTDEGSTHRLTLSHSALSHRPGSHGARAMATISTDRERLAAIVAADEPLAQAPDRGVLEIAGDAAAVRRLFGTFDEFPSNFNIVEP